MKGAEMIDKKTVTPDALKLLSAIMRTCPATPFNGGDHAKKHLEILCGKDQDISGCELRAGIKMIEGCNCEGEVDVYTDLLLHTESQQVTRLDVMKYFGGQVHADKIFKTATNDFPKGYSLKIVYGHLLLPVFIANVEKGIAHDINLINSLGILKFSNTEFQDGERVMMHYGFFVDKITKEELEILSDFNNQCDLFKKACNTVGPTMDFRKMHYYPRSLKMSKE